MGIHGKNQRIKNIYQELVIVTGDELEMMVLLMAKIRQSPVEVGSVSHCLQGFIHPRWFRILSIKCNTLKK